MSFKAIFTKVWVETNDGLLDISDTISSINYSRAIDKENAVSFKVEQKYTQALTDVFIRKGQTIQFQYGYLSGKKSLVRKARVTGIDYDYSSNITMSIKARDLSTVVKKTSSNQVWRNKTTSTIAKEIASRYGLEFEGIETTKIWDYYPQAQKDDYSFLMELVAQDDDGNLQVWVDDDKLYLKRYGTNTASKLTFKYKSDDRILNFKPSLKESQTSTSAASSSTFVGFDPNTNETLVEEANKDTEEKNIQTGEFDFLFSGAGELKNTPEEKKDTEGFFGKVIDLGKVVVSGLGDRDALKNKAQSKKKSSTYFQNIAKLKIIGEPTLELNQVITMSGEVLKIHSGTWLIKEIQDTLTAAGEYTTSLDLVKNATRKQTTNNPNEEKQTNSTKVNNTVGKSENETKKTILVFDGDGTKITDATTQFIAPKNNE